MTRHRQLALVIALAACESKSGGSEQQFVETELAHLRTALATRTETAVAVGCVAVTSSLERMPAKLAAEIAQLCHVEAPRLHLELAVASVKKSNGEHPELTDINCMQLFVEDAFETMAAHPSKDAALKQLADEYARLCPASVAKLRAP